VAGDQIADGGSDVAECKAPIDDELDLARVDELAENDQSLRVLRRDERAQLLPEEKGEQERPDLAATAAVRMRVRR